MKTNQYPMIIGAVKGFGKAMTFDRDKHLTTVVLVAMSDNELDNLSVSVNKKCSGPENHNISEMPHAFRFMVMLINKLTPDLSPESRHLRFAGCMQRDIYLS